MSEWEQGPSKHCRFRRVNGDLGVKYYPTEEERDHCYAMQQKAFTVHAAPHVGNYLLPKTIEGATWYGFETGLAEITDTWNYHEINELRDKLAIEGIRQPDIRGIGNVGMYGGHLVCVDFDTAWIDEGLVK